MSRPPSAYALEQAISALQQAKERLLTDDPDMAQDERLLHDMLEGDTDAGDYMAVLHNVLLAAVHAESMAAAAKNRAKEMTERYQRYTNRAATLRAASFDAMQALELRRVELPELTATIAAGTPRVVVTDEAALDEVFIRTVREPNKSAISAALKSGATVPGAEFSNAPPSIRIRTT